MAKGLPNTDPALGRLNKSSEETLGVNKEIADAGIGTLGAMKENLVLISSFTEVMKNYIPKLGFIDAHTTALKLKQDQAFKVLESIDETLKKQAEVVEEEQPEEDATAQELVAEGIADAQPIEVVEGPSEVESEAAEDARASGDAVEIIFPQKMVDNDALKVTLVDEDPREEQDGAPGGAKGDGKKGDDKKKKEEEGPIKKFFKRLGKLFTVVNLIIVGIVASLLTGSQGLFTALKSLFNTLMEVFTQLLDIVLTKLLPVFTQVFTVVVELIDAVLPPLMEIFSMMVDVVMDLVDMLLPPLMEIFTVIVEVVMSIVDALMPIIESIIAFLMPIIQMVVDYLMFIFDTILAPVLKILAPLVETVGDLLMSFFNVLINLWNGLLEGAASLIESLGFGWTGVADDIRAYKAEEMQKDTSKDDADKIDWTASDEEIDNKINTMLKNEEINEKTAEALIKDKEKHKKAAAKKKEKEMDALQVKRAEVPDALKKDGEKIELLSMDLSDVTGGATGKVLVDPNSVDENNNYAVYDEEGNPLTFDDKSNEAVMMAIHGGVENLRAKEAGSEEGSFSMGALLGLDTEAGEQGLNLADESLDTGEAQADAQGGAGGDVNTNVVTSKGGDSQSVSNKTVIVNDGGSGDPQASRGYVYLPN